MHDVVSKFFNNHKNTKDVEKKLDVLKIFNFLKFNKNKILGSIITNT